MKRRNFIRSLSTSLLTTGLIFSEYQVLSLFSGPIQHRLKGLAEYLKKPPQKSSAHLIKEIDLTLEEYLRKMHRFNSPHPGDIFARGRQRRLYRSIYHRLCRLQNFVGHSNFNIINFDWALKTAENASAVGAFRSAEIQAMEELFYTDATRYGFLGEKPFTSITESIPNRKIVKVPYSGNFLYKGKPYTTFLDIRSKIGNQVMLTSGVRGIMKQFYLFLRKASLNDWNLSLASRSLAPPGYSFHGISDFDVGKAGFGLNNFTANFIYTDVYKRLEDLGYLTLRYPRDNMLGVRFEPWHIKITS